MGAQPRLHQRARISAYQLAHQRRCRRRAEIQIHAAASSAAHGHLVPRLSRPYDIRSGAQYARSRGHRAAHHDRRGNPCVAARSVKGPHMQLSDVDYRDIQGLVRFAYSHLKEAHFHLLRIADVGAARSWLAAAPVTTAVKHKPPDTALQVAFTYEGLMELGGSPDILKQFPHEFISGM